MGLLGLGYGLALADPRVTRANPYMDTIDSVGLGGQPLDDKVEEEIPRL